MAYNLGILFGAWKEEEGTKKNALVTKQTARNEISAAQRFS